MADTLESRLRNRIVGDQTRGPIDKETPSRTLILNGGTYPCGALSLFLRAPTAKFGPWFGRPALLRSPLIA
jgi:hypothetical protein